VVLAAVIADAGGHACIGVVDGLHHLVQVDVAAAVGGRGDGEVVLPTFRLSVPLV
jgi:hypothetical protein